MCTVEVSIVTGTFNRISYLKRMVESVRHSVGVGIPYEVVVVDAGSTDGTPQWCKEQKDIKFIQQGKLLGAVKAFNAGAYVATGKYVILANDDIEFIDYSILSAISFMQDNLLVGIGCFYQDRRGQDFHVEHMSVVINGRQSHTYYGQVCIVPKWLGDKVGWWGDYLYTYGGDNELSCNVYELGYKVLPIPCAYIHDALPSDALRVENNDKLIKNGKHPDSEAWVKKWTRKGLQGPSVRSLPKDPILLEKLIRFFYMPIFEPGHNIQKTAKRGLRDALARVGLVVECDYLVTPWDEIMDMACCFEPNVFIMQMHGIDQMPLVHNLKNQHPDAIFVNWNGDYHPEYLLNSRYVSFMKEFDHVGVVSTSVKDVYNAFGVNWFYWQIGYEEYDETIKYRSVPKYDILFMANGYSKSRLELVKELKDIDGLTIGLYGNWPAAIRANGNTIYDFNAGAQLYKNCKIAIGDSQWPQATGYVSNRLFQAMSAGAFMLHQYFDGMEELLGLRSGEHLVTWISIDDLCDKIDYYLTHDAVRRQIAARGCKFVKENHSFDCRVKELMKRINAT